MVLQQNERGVLQLKPLTPRFKEALLRFKTPHHITYSLAGHLSELAIEEKQADAN